MEGRGLVDYGTDAFGLNDGPDEEGYAGDGDEDRFSSEEVAAGMRVCVGGAFYHYQVPGAHIL